MGNRQTLTALFEYEHTSNEDISIKKGDRLKLNSKTDADWWNVTNTRTGSRGLVPACFVTPITDLARYDYFHGQISRKEAAKILQPGTFLIRYSERNKNSFSLSLKTVGNNGDCSVVHYKINFTGKQYWIKEHDFFTTLDELVKYYQNRRHGLCMRLNKPCPKQKPDLYDVTPLYRTKFEIPREDITCQRRLGSGNFGEVWYGMWKNRTEVAVKTLIQDRMTAEEFLKEAAIMKKLRHQKLVSLYGVCVVGGDILIVTEFMKLGNLLSYLRSSTSNRPPFDDLVYIVEQVAEGMAYLEKNSMVHRDLAARNILITDNNRVKVADFGLARDTVDAEYQAKNNFGFPVKWTAPEAFQFGTFTTKSDVWSYGILLYEVFTYGAVPYGNRSNTDVMNGVIRGLRLAKPLHFSIPDPIYEEMKKCWNLDPDSRPTFSYLEHYFETYLISSEDSYA